MGPAAGAFYIVRRIRIDYNQNKAGAAFSDRTGKYRI